MTIYGQLSFLLLTFGLAYAQTNSSSLNGKLCMTVASLKVADNSTQFFECAAFAADEAAAFKMPEKSIGTWRLRDCPRDYEFDEVKQRCVDRKVFRRQQVTCSNNPTASGCAVPCTTASPIPSVGGACNWMTSQLQADPLSSGYFLNCAPQSPSASCGEWVRVPCSEGTTFEISVEACIPTVSKNPCSASQMPLCDCASINNNMACPGTSSCTQNICCQDFEVLGNSIQQQMPMMCPGSFVPPLASCMEGCPEYSSCMPGVGCCPMANSIVNPQFNFCPGSFYPPVGSCGNCPSGTSCNSNSNMCCPNTDVTYNVIALCPDGSQSSGACSNNGCGNGNACYRGSCCPMRCPTGQTALGFCNSGSCGSGQCYQPGGSCCQEAIKLPVCQNGMTATKRCMIDQECGSNMECTNGGCCPMPFCPTGIMSSARCSASFSCPVGQSCMEGLCCPLPKCPNGVISLGICSTSFDCGRVGVECANGACCPLPMCPNNVVSSQRCSSGCSNCCPAGQQCMNGGCCQLPSCSNGIIALSTCNNGGCGVGNECYNGGCCPLPRCPSGLQASQRCSIGMGCGPGNQCENGVCCPVPMCSTGSIAVSVCGSGNSCPIGYLCEGRGCCQEPMPLCPNGGRAAQRCNRGSDCAPGYGCTPLGGCCLLSMEPVCPMRSSPVCQCSPNNGCPNGASCNMGTCCSSGLIAMAQVPGSSCQASTQCNGFSNSCASCVQGICSCTSGSASNGASCIMMSPNNLRIARNGCDQYGSPCKFLLSPMRRRPIFAPVSNVTGEEPLFFNVGSARKCVSDTNGLSMDGDNTCLPNEKCIDGECKRRLWPGEYGCNSDMECESRCSNTYCEKRKTDKKVPQCQCKNGLLLFGRCFSECPQGFHESGAYCAFNDEEDFWTNADMQNNIKDLLNADQC